ncbi:hypothetical protein BDZ94DRAFT_1269344 [Collybia nuda]|uniref:Uncharacterized protein n=1 Tax=Collybia nuda TaxID=64659 RepID=A0A9P5XWP8_9AGAR|nr:hypothetical protein BDZ94DRAFT_1269344 [Collybia nuda]
MSLIDRQKALFVTLSLLFHLVLGFTYSCSSRPASILIWGLLLFSSLFIGHLYPLYGYFAFISSIGSISFLGVLPVTSDNIGLDVNPTAFWTVNSLLLIAILAFSTAIFDFLISMNGEEHGHYVLCRVSEYFAEIVVLKQKASKPVLGEAERGPQYHHAPTPINETTETSPPPYKLSHTQEIFSRSVPPLLKSGRFESNP